MFSRLIKKTQKDEPFDDTSPENFLFSIDNELGVLTFEEIETATSSDKISENVACALNQECGLLRSQLGGTRS